MGFFSLKSRQFRQKIRDLRAELEQAEREGNYIVEQGLYFASHRFMSETTQGIMSDDVHTGEEAQVARAFFDRNGFTVEEMKLNTSQGLFTDLDIIPPNEMLVALAVAMQAKGYRVIDDSDREQPFDFSDRICPVSQLTRAVSILFARRVQKVISGTRVKLTKEGNRLLSLMPGVIKSLGRKVDQEVIYALEYDFDEAFDHFYSGEIKRKSGEKSRLELRLDKIGKSDLLDVFSLDQVFSPLPLGEVPAEKKEKPSMIVATQTEPSDSMVSFDTQAANPWRSPSPIQASPPGNGTPDPVGTGVLHPVESLQAAPHQPSAAAASSQEKPEALSLQKIRQNEQFAKALAVMYRGLVKAAPQKSASNAQMLLQQIAKLLETSAACILIRSPQAEGLRMHAQCGDLLAWGKGPGRPVHTALVRECIQRREPVTAEAEPTQSDTSFAPPLPTFTAAAPILVNQHLAGVLYVERLGEQKRFHRRELKILDRLAQVFQEFPDLTLGL